MSLIDDLNVLLSDLTLVVIRTHNVHWNVESPLFGAIHSFTDGLYDDYLDQIDEVAEMIRMREGRPLVTMADYLKKTTLKETSKNTFNASDSCKTVLDDLEAIRETVTDLRKKASDEDDYSLGMKLEEYIAYYDKKIWMVKAMLK